MMEEIKLLTGKLKTFVEKPLKEEVALMINNYELDEKHRGLITQILEACDKIEALEEKKVDKVVKDKSLRKDLHLLLKNIHDEIIKLEFLNKKENDDKFIEYYNNLLKDVNTLNKLIENI